MAARRSRRPAGAAVSGWPSGGDAYDWPFPHRSPRPHQPPAPAPPSVGRPRREGGPVIQAGLYLRMSRDAEARGLGIGRQRKDGEALANRLGWPIVLEYSDNDLSASKYSRKPRPAYLR